MAVSEAHRRRRIATRPIQELKVVAKEKKAYVIYVQADPGDTASLALYESLGTREEDYHYDIPLDGK